MHREVPSKLPYGPQAVDAKLRCQAKYGAVLKAWMHREVPSKIPRGPHAMNAHEGAKQNTVHTPTRGCTEVTKQITGG